MQAARGKVFWGCSPGSLVSSFSASLATKMWTVISRVSSIVDRELFIIVPSLLWPTYISRSCELKYIPFALSYCVTVFLRRCEAELLTPDRKLTTYKLMISTKPNKWDSVITYSNRGLKVSCIFESPTQHEWHLTKSGFLKLSAWLPGSWTV